MNDVAFTLVPIGVIVAFLAGLIVLQPDLGTAVSLLVVSVTLLFVAGLDLRWLAVSAIFAVPVFYLLVFRVKYRRERILAFINPWEQPLGRGFQIIQSMLSVAVGRRGWAWDTWKGSKSFFICRKRIRTSSFAVVGEELGMIGTCAVLFSSLCFSGAACAQR